MPIDDGGGAGGVSSDNHRRRDPQWVSRALREFLAVPLIVVAAFLLLATLSIVLDQSHAAWLSAPRRVLGHVVGKGAASAALSAIATGLVTVTSITFSVLLLALQQTAASLSPVVFDQFVRRRSNQVYLGFFIGLAVYSYVVLAAVQQSTPPVLGAALAVLLTAVALLILLTLVYSTLNQMRPVNVIFAIRTAALIARSHELDILRHTRRTPLRTGAPAATALSRSTGYVTGIDVEAMQAACAQAPEAEVELVVTLGMYVVVGDPLALVRGTVEEAGCVTDAFRDDVIELNRQRDPDVDATASVEELANIAWTSGSTAKHSPEIAAEALNALRDLLCRWSPAADEGVSGNDVLPVVYRDDDCERVVDSMLGMVAVAHESQQQQTMARVLAAFTLALPRLREADRWRVAAGLHEAAPMLAQGAWTPKLRGAGARVSEVLAQVGCNDAADALATAFQQEHDARRLLR
ncbi:MAG: DUF2254 domain-containing protein [Actinomycetota bacterium]|nr:DUF2254 domain-containing protein [Actinomycetota bacterium]